MQTFEEYLSTGQGARRLGVAGITVRSFIRTGKLSAMPTPVGLLVRVDDLERFEKSRAEARSERKGQYGQKAQR